MRQFPMPVGLPSPVYLRLQRKLNRAFPERDGWKVVATGAPRDMVIEVTVQIPVDDLEDAECRTKRKR